MGTAGRYWGLGTSTWEESCPVCTVGLEGLRAGCWLLPGAVDFVLRVLRAGHVDVTAKPQSHGGAVAAEGARGPGAGFKALL